MHTGKAKTLNSLNDFLMPSAAVDVGEKKRWL